MDFFNSLLDPLARHLRRPEQSPLARPVSTSPSIVGSYFGVTGIGLLTFLVQASVLPLAVPANAIAPDRENPAVQIFMPKYQPIPR